MPDAQLHAFGRLGQMLSLHAAAEGGCRHLYCCLPLSPAADRHCLVCLWAGRGCPLPESRHGNLPANNCCRQCHDSVSWLPRGQQPLHLCWTTAMVGYDGKTAGQWATLESLVLLSSWEHSPDASTGMSQVLPCQGPAGRACVLSRIRTVATMSLSATGSRKAPNADTVPYKDSATFCQRLLPAPACSVHTRKDLCAAQPRRLGLELSCPVPR